MAHFIYFSTISSGLNSIAACILEDVIRAYFVKEMTESRATLVSRIIGRYACLILFDLILYVPSTIFQL